MKVFRTWLWPLLLSGGLLIVALSMGPWGVSSEGVRPGVNGLGRVSVPGASQQDVAFLESHTEQPGLVTVGLGALIVVAAALGWALPKAKWIALAICGVAGLGSVITAVIILTDPAGHLLDDAVNEALGTGPQVLSPGYGLIGVLIVGLVVIGAVVSGALARPSRAGVAGDAGRVDDLDDLTRTDEPS